MEMQTFVAVVDAGSFVRAAEAPAMSKAAVSRYVAELEARLGVRLLHRTTRKLSLTGEGEVFHARCQELLAERRRGRSRDHLAQRRGQRAGEGQRAGHLRPAAPGAAVGGVHGAAPEGHARRDAGRPRRRPGRGRLRPGGAHRPAAELVADQPQLSATRMVLCASPQYLQRAGTPQHPSELTQHAVLAYSLCARCGDHWHFDGPRGPVSVKVTPRMRTNSGDTCRAAALQHQGIVLQPTFLVGPDLAAGSLVEVMPAFRSASSSASTRSIRRASTCRRRCGC